MSFSDGNQYSLETEKALLALILVEVGLRGSIFYQLNPEYFFDPQHSKIFGEMQELYSKNHRFDQNQLLDRIKNIGVNQYINNTLTPDRYSTENLEAYVEDLSKKHLLREAYKIAETFCQTIESKKDVETELIAKITSDLISLTAEEEVDIEINNLIEEFKNSYKEQKERDSKLLGISTGIKKLDKITMGIKPKELTIVAGPTSTGKTSLGINFVSNMLKEDIPLLFISLEMGRVDVLHRLLAMSLEINLTTIQLATTTKKQDEIIAKELEHLQTQQKLFINDSLLNLNKLISLIRITKAQKNIKTVIIDYLQYVPGLRLLEDYTKLTRSLSQLAKELDIAIIGISQMNREHTKREDKRPQLSDLRASGSLEEDSGTIIMLYAPFRYTKRDEDKNDLYALVEKNRKGAIGEVKLKFNKNVQKIGDSVKAVGLV